MHFQQQAIHMKELKWKKNEVEFWSVTAAAAAFSTFRTVSYTGTLLTCTIRVFPLEMPRKMRALFTPWTTCNLDRFEEILKVLNAFLFCEKFHFNRSNIIEMPVVRIDSHRKHPNAHAYRPNEYRSNGVQRTCNIKFMWNMNQKLSVS